MSEPASVLWAGLATIGFAILFGVRGRDLPLSAAAATAGWAVALLVEEASGSQGIGFFAAAAVVGLFAEVLAVLRKRPATLYVVCSIIPLVPGSGMYHTMLESVRGNTWSAFTVGMSTVVAAGAIAAGLAVSGAVSRLLSIRSLARRLKAGL